MSRLQKNIDNQAEPKYDALKDIEFIQSVMLRTPMILHLKSNKRTGMFTEWTTDYGIYRNTG